ncbi:MAG: hypothetical protein ACSHX0_10250 [Akkermansiaceae bacterium]
MIYEEEIIISGKLIPSAFQPNEVWQEIGGFLQHRKCLGEAYEVNLQMERSGENDTGVTKLISSDLIERELCRDEGVPTLWATLPPKKGILPDQRLTYSTRREKLNLSGKLGHFPDEWDSFFMTSNIGENLVNALVHPRSFRKALRAYKTPPENDLLKAPGLANDRGDYLEGVAAEMWFGESFWQYASCTKEDLKACDWLKCDDRNFQLHVEAWDGPFTSAEGEQGEMQRELLKMLFGIGK